MTAISALMEELVYWRQEWERRQSHFEQRRRAADKATRLLDGAKDDRYAAVDSILRLRKALKAMDPYSNNPNIRECLAETAQIVAGYSDDSD